MLSIISLSPAWTSLFNATTIEVYSRLMELIIALGFGTK